MTKYKLPEHVAKRAVKLPNGMVMIPVEDDRKAIIEPVELGQDGIAYIQKLLLEQNKPLSTAVAQLFNGQGIAFAPLEKGESLEQAKQFSAGNWRPTVAIRKWLAAYIESSDMQNAPQLIIEDPWAVPSDAGKRKRKVPYFLCQGGVYYAPAGSTLYDAVDVGERQSNFLMFGFVISPPVALPPTGKDVDVDYIELLAQNTKAVFARAYDGEGYVVWQKSP